MENYKEKYEQALETARKINSGEGVAAPKDWNALEVIFPELKKNEDEMIKTNIIKLLRFVRDAHHQYFDECNKAINWLEKQSEQKSVDRVKPKFKVGDTIINKYFRWDGNRRIKEITDDKYIFNGESYINIKEQDEWELDEWIFCLENKPKFKVGDWVIFKDGSVYQVEKIENYEYTLRHILGGSMPLPFGSQNLIRSWTIQDVKDGDVLVCEGKISKDKYGQEVGIVKKYVGRIGGCDNCFKTYCFIDWDGNFIVDKDMGSSNIHPATKEQCNLLFQKIEEAGYEWDSNKKELIKYGQ